MKKSSGRSFASQIIRSVVIVLAALWIVAYAAHLSGGLITYLLFVSALILFISSANRSKKAGAPRHRAAEADVGREAA
jgi:hypothetical protein